ncbi:MAG: hypothetical protein WBC71_12530 [Salaquimonas sp.]
MSDIATGDLPAAMTVSQGECIGRKGKIQVSRLPDDTIPFGGKTQFLIEGQLDL